MDNQPKKPGPKVPAHPTMRQRQILAWVCAGKTNEEIAVLIGISRLGVKAHMQALIRRMGAPNRTGAAVLALQRGYVTLDTLTPVPPSKAFRSSVEGGLPEFCRYCSDPAACDRKGLCGNPQGNNE